MSKRNIAITPRRFLPPFDWLSAFEAVARKGSVTEAAHELCLTQGAVSRQIQKLEGQIGAVLFVRDRRRMKITPAGAAYLKDVRRGIDIVMNAGIRLHANPAGGPLNLAVLPAFGAQWLAPRLPDFVASCPGVTLNMSTRTRPFDFATEDFHAAIHFGEDGWQGTESEVLMDEKVVAVASPEIATLGGQGGASDARDLPLLHLETRTDAWRIWFANQGIEVKNLSGVRFDQFSSMIQAAVVGLGAAIVPEYLIRSELADGRLVLLGGTTQSAQGQYFLVWPEQNKNYPPLLQFKNWIVDTAKRVPEGWI